MPKPFVCTVELSKTTGITVKVFNEEGKITQTIEMDGTSIITTVKDDNGDANWGKKGSKITQQAESIAINCREFKLDAETITCTSEKATKHVSQDTFSIQSTKDLTISSDAKINQEAAQDFIIKGNKLNATGTQEATFTGGKGVLKGTSSAADLSGPNVSISGQTKVEIKGAQVKGSATGALEMAASGTAKLQGNMTQIGGSMIKIG